MALQTSITIHGILLTEAYISIVKSRTEKLYPKDENGNVLPPIYQTWVHIGGAVSKDLWEKGDRFSLNHSIPLIGELKREEIYPILKTIQIPQFEIDFSNSIDV